MAAPILQAGKFTVPGYLHAEIGIRSIGRSLPPWVDRDTPVDEEPDFEIVILHDPALVKDPEGPAVKFLETSRPRYRFIVTDFNMNEIVPAYHHLMVLASHDNLNFIANALAALASGILLVGLDIHDVLEAAKVKTMIGDPGEPGTPATSLVLKGIVKEQGGLPVQGLLRSFAWQQWDSAVLFIQLVSEEDMPSFSLDELDRFFASATEEKFIENCFLTAAAARESGVALIAI